jgi:small subunit ribosomal protein S8
MSVTLSDPIADLLTRIRNASKATHPSVTLPSSKFKESVVKVLAEAGYIDGYLVTNEAPQSLLRVDLKYNAELEPAVLGLKRISKPGLRIYTGFADIGQVLGGVGISVISTSQGVMTGGQARRRRLGGEVICHIW